MKEKSRFARIRGVALAGAVLAIVPLAARSFAGTPEDTWKPARVEDAPSAAGAYSITPLLQFGGASAPEAAQFFEKTGAVQVDADANGNIYVLDDGNQRVQVFDSKGVYLRTVGGPGQGPGEFQLPHKLSVNARGELAVYDLGQQRLSLFEASGKLRRDQVFGSMIRDVELLDDGGIVVAHEEGRPAVLERFDANGNTVWQFAKAEPEAEGSRVDMRFRFSRAISPLLAVTGREIFAGSDDAYCIHAVSLAGKDVAAFARRYDRQKMKLPTFGGGEGEEGRKPRMVMVTRTEQRGPAGEGHSETNVQTGEEARIQLDQNDLAKMMPEFAPDLRGLLAWPDGRLWAITSMGDDDTMSIDEWSAEGRYLRSFTIDGDYDRIRVGSDGQLYAVGHDDDEFAIVYRLQATESAR